MGKESISVLHIDTERTWRGGQQQVGYLVKAMKKQDYQTAIICQPQSPLEKFCCDKSIPCIPVSMIGEMDFFAGFRISLICKQQNFNILHLHSGHALAIGIWAKLFNSKFKLVASRRVDYHIKKNWFSQFKYKSRFIDKIVCISYAIENVLIQDDVPQNKLVTIHSGIDINKFSNMPTPENFKRDLGIAENKILIGTIAAMSGQKDYPNLLKAAKIVVEQNDDVIFCAVGDGPHRQKIIKMADEFGLMNRFIFAGFREDIGNFLKAFDIFVLASKKEGLGTSILDAQSVGLPVIACEVGGIPEIISDGKNGLLVPPKNEQKLAEAILKLVKNTQFRKKLGENARESVKQFDIHRTIEKNIKLYEQILS